MIIGIFTDTYTPDINGVVTSIKMLEDELTRHGHEVYIITASNQRRIIREGNVIKMPGVALKKLYGYSLSNFYSFIGANYIKKLNLEIIHTQTEYGIGIFARVFALKENIPLVYTYHTMWEDYSSYVLKLTRGKFEKNVKRMLINFTKLYAENNSALIVPSQKTKDVMLRYGVEIDINVVPTGIDLSRFNRDNFSDEQINALRKELDVEDCFVALFVGRIASEKNIVEVIESFKLVKKQDKNIKFIIVGDGPDYEEYNELVTKYGLDVTINMVGSVNNEIIPLYYQIADVFISTSLSETQGLTFIEAMASHVPAISRYDKNLADIVVDGETGFIVSDVNDLANKIVKMAHLSDDEYQRMQNNAYEIAKSYSSEIFYERIMKVYDDAIRINKESLSNHKDKKTKQSLRTSSRK